LRLLERATFEEACRVRISGELAMELQACLGEYVRYVMERDVRTTHFVESLRNLPPIVMKPGTSLATAEAGEVDIAEAQ
jgi:hypothetical protein